MDRGGAVGKRFGSAHPGAEERDLRRRRQADREKGDGGQRERQLYVGMQRQVPVCFPQDAGEVLVCGSLSGVGKTQSQ